MEPWKSQGKAVKVTVARKKTLKNLVRISYKNLAAGDSRMQGTKVQGLFIQAGHCMCT
jgi:hypothetical protein